MEISQNSNQESNVTKNWKYHKIVIKNQMWQDCKISHNWYQESSLTKLQNITQLVSRIKFNKVAKYQKNLSLTTLRMLQKHQT